MENQCGIILLAAGASSRLGSPKQSLVYGSQTLLEHSIGTALGSGAQKTVVVLGAGATTLQPAITSDKLSYIENSTWQEGMASSIRYGLEYITSHFPAIQNVLFMACDQPYVSIELLDKLVTLQKETGSPVVASQYSGTTGIPAIFNQLLFPELMQLKGDRGARKLIAAHHDKVLTVDFPKGAIDIDTGEDYRNLLKM